MNYADLKGFIFYDGNIVKWSEAKLHVLSHGLHYASSVFEGERSYNNGNWINNISDGYIRPVAWRGSEMMGISAQSNTIHSCIGENIRVAFLLFTRSKIKRNQTKYIKMERPDPFTAPVNTKAAGLYTYVSFNKKLKVRAMMIAPC